MMLAPADKPEDLASAIEDLGRSHAACAKHPHLADLCRWFGEYIRVSKAPKLGTPPKRVPQRKGRPKKGMENRW